MSENNAPVLRLMYDTSLNPLSFDFVFCLAITRALCNVNKLSDSFDVVLVNKEYRNVGIESNYSNEYRERKVRDVLFGTAMLCKWVNSIQIVRGMTPVLPYAGPVIPSADALKNAGKIPQWHITPMVPRQLELLLKRGARIPEYGFRASEKLLNLYRDRLKQAVVLHPRVSSQNFARNSEKEKIQQLIRLLRADGLDVFFVPDIEDLWAGFTWRDLDAEPLLEAACDMETRLAVSEAALTNLLYGGGGNTTTLHFTPASFLVTGMVDESQRVRSSSFFAEKGPTMHSNPPWLDRTTQIYDWTPNSNVTSTSVHKQLIDLVRKRQSTR